MTEERSEKSIDQMEQDAGAEEDSVPAPPVTKDTVSSDPWGGEERKKDQFSDRDAEPRVKIYTLGIPNKPAKDGQPNPGYRRLCLDKKMGIAPREVIRCVVLHRTYPNLAQVPFKEAQKLPESEPWRRYLGYSFEGERPTPDSAGKYFKLCKNAEGVAFKMCSLETQWDDDGHPIETPLKDGECPWGRWGNSMVEADRGLKWKIPIDATPTCNNQIILYCWDLDIMVPFRAYFKVTSYGYADDFLGSCTIGVGDNAKKRPFHAFVAHITVEDRDEYAVSKIVNTKQFTDPAQIKPIVKWFEENKSIFVQNLSLQMEEAKKRADKATDFKKEDYEG